MGEFAIKLLTIILMGTLIFLGILAFYAGSIAENNCIEDCESYGFDYMSLGDGVCWCNENTTPHILPIKKVDLLKVIKNE